MTIPKRGSNPYEVYDLPKFEDKSIFWVISVGDKRISNIENIIIWICMVWGFLRLIDLLRFMEKYKSV